MDDAPLLSMTNKSTKAHDLLLDTIEQSEKYKNQFFNVQLRAMMCRNNIFIFTFSTLHRWRSICFIFHIVVEHYEILCLHFISCFSWNHEFINSSYFQMLILITWQSYMENRFISQEAIEIHFLISLLFHYFSVSFYKSIK